MSDLLQLYPPSGVSRSLTGLYLELELHRVAAAGELLIYANYIASVDGRISLRDGPSGQFVVPDAIANPRDWRLYQELAAQADVMLTSGRYFRQLAAGCAQDLLPVGREQAYADLRSWRVEQGMRSQPDVVVISRSLDIPPAALEQLHGRRVLICTCGTCDAQQADQLRSMGAELIVSGAERVDGGVLKQALIERGYRSAYMIAGPEIHRTMIADGVLDMLFLSTRLNLLGGDAFHTILSGALDSPQALQLLRLFLDQHASSPQLFAQYALHRG